MYETTVSVPTEQDYLLDCLKDRVLPQICKIDAVSTDIAENGRRFFCLACNNTFAKVLQREIKWQIAEIISLGYKNLFFRRLLGVSDDNFYQSVLVNTLCVFDNDQDKQQVAQVLETDKPLFLDGYYNFRLNNLKSKWTEVSHLICDNVYVMQDKDLIVEFLQYLLDAVNCKCKTLSVTFQGDGFELYDSDNKVVESIRSLARTTTAESEAMLNVLCVKPKLLKVIYKTKPSQEFCDLSEKLFDVEYVKVV